MLLGCICAAAALNAAPAQAQAAAPPATLTIDQALTYAGAHHPAITAGHETATATEADVTVARDAYLPRLDALWQSNRATVNNVFGQLLPQSVVPSISGPVLSTTSGAGVWGSTVGGLLTWEPFDFGQRGAGVRIAETSLARARAGESLTRLEIEATAGTRFLQAVAASLAVDVAAADVARRDVFGTAIKTLVDNELRPGADLSRADAERAAARTRLIQAREAALVARIELARAIGVAGDVVVDGGRLADRMAGGATGAAGTSGHPLALLQNASIDLAKARADSTRLSMRPKFLLQTSASARGSGASVTGDHDGSLGGLALDRANWAGGLQVVFPNPFDWRAQHARTAAADASVRAETARRDDALLGLSAQQQVAAARLDAARAIALNTPIQLAAARQSESQSRARYDAGLASIIEVAEAQSLLAAAEYGDRLARINTWLALLDVSIAQGDITPFLNAVRAQ